MFRKSFLIALGALTAISVAAMSSLAQENAPPQEEAGIEAGIETVAPDATLASPFAQAIAYVGDGKIQSSKGFIAFSNPFTGFYCLTPPKSLKPSVPVVSVEYFRSFGVNLFALWDSDDSDCPAGAFEVLTFKGDKGGPGSAYQIPVLSEDVAFVILVP
jgi:hypothetical protein